jgi:small conductance mechanosensitive channel
MRIVCALLALVLSLPLLAQSVANEDRATSKLQQEMEELTQEFTAIHELSQRIELAPEVDRTALIYRLDNRLFAALSHADRVAAQIDSLPEASTAAEQLEQRLTSGLRGIPEAITPRLEQLDQQAAQAIAALDGLSGIERVSAEIELTQLMAVRYRYFEALVNHIETRTFLGLPTDELRSGFKQLFYLQAESVAGRLQYLESAVTEMDQRLEADPKNPDFHTTVKRLADQRRLQLDHMRALVGLMERLELDATSYKSLLVQRGGGVSVDMIERGVALQLVTDYLAQLRTTVMKGAPDFLFKGLIFVGVLLLFRILARLTRKMVRSGCERSSLDMSVLLKDTLESLSGGAVMIMGILMALSQVGISLGPMLAGLGIAGFIVGFALQDTLANFAAGAMILIYRPYDVDDFVEVTGASGEVKKMNLVSTTITTFDNQTLVVPNNKIWGDVIKNVTAQKVRRVDLQFGIGYNDDIEHAEQVLAAVAQEHDLVLSAPATNIKVHSLGDSSVNLILRPWVKTADYWTVYWDLTREVKLRFDREGISIPFPQRDIHVYPTGEGQQEA